jgi:hypothetical protein
MVALSCLPTGECIADGYDDNGSTYSNEFTITQTDGTWSDPQEVPGTTASQFGFGSLSCSSVGNCLAGGGGGNVGFYDTTQAATATETDGIWNDPQEVPGMATLNPKGPRNQGSSVEFASCPPDGSCVIVGYYMRRNASGDPVDQVFVVGEVRR